MLVLVKSKPTIMGNLQDLYGEEMPELKGMDGDDCEYTEAAFAGERHKVNEYRIPAADVHGREVFFNHEELLKRYAQMPLLRQECLLKRIRAVMKRLNCLTLLLTISWGPKPRTLEILANGIGDDPSHAILNFNLK